jgi:hypothetical protein
MDEIDVHFLYRMGWSENLIKSILMVSKQISDNQTIQVPNSTEAIIEPKCWSGKEAIIPEEYYNTNTYPRFW